MFWRSKRQDIIVGDTTEAELIGMSAAANELIWLKKFCADLAIDAQKPTLWGDNKGANLIAVNPVSSDRSSDQAHTCATPEGERSGGVG